MDKEEFRKGWVETQKYVLSHHGPSNWNRCYNMPIFSHNVRICARCSGIYPGIIIGLSTFHLISGNVPIIILLFLLPLPALLDWSLTSFTKLNGKNISRSLTGALLGYAYGIGLVELILVNNFLVLWLGLFYALIAGFAMWILHHQVNLNTG